MNWAELTQRYRGNTAFIDRLAALALQVNGDKPAQLRQWAATGNLQEIGAAAHALKSLAGNLAAGPTLALAEATQHAAHDDQPDTNELALRLADSLELLFGALAAYLEHRGNVTPALPPG